jgi:hypothetical protein
LLGGGRKVGAGEIEGEDEGLEARLVDGIEAGLVDLRPGGEEAGFGVEVTIVAGEAVGEGKGEHEVEVLFGLDALVANALVGEGAFGVKAREGMRGGSEMYVGFMDEVPAQWCFALGCERGGERWRDEGVGLGAGLRNWRGVGSGVREKRGEGEEDEAVRHGAPAVIFAGFGVQELISCAREILGR